MWLTSKTPQPWRTALCSAVMPLGYWIGISKPANETIFAPAARWMAWKGVFLRVSDEAADIGRGFGMQGGGAAGVAASQQRGTPVQYAEVAGGMLSDARAG